MELGDWAARGERIVVGDAPVHVVDTPARQPGSAPPLLVLHGFPTSSVDWAAVLDDLSETRRVVLFDFPGFGLSDKPDRPYGITSAADAAAGVIDVLGLDELDLVTHDMGDTVGGELLARDLEGTLTAGGAAVTIRRRVVTNGSIYLDMARLTDGQKLMWESPDAALPEDEAPDAVLLEMALTATLAPPEEATSRPDPAHVRVAAESVCHGGGARLLPRLIRYLSDRRANESRFTGAVESHPARLGIVWGALDPIAVVDMAHRLRERRDDASLDVLDGVGHYPMIEAPGTFAAAILRALDPS